MLALVGQFWLASKVLLLGFWGKHKNKYSLEWFLNAITKRFASSGS